MHAFGIGQGVSVDLIKKCGMAGKGQIEFIIKEDEIERKVLKSLQKAYIDCIFVKEISLYDSNN